jgi:hypothetical protein
MRSRKTAKTATRARRARETAQDTAHRVAAILTLDDLRAMIHARFGPLLERFVDAAIGIRHVLERDPVTGQWTRVTDPARLEALLNDPVSSQRTTWTVYTRDPDLDALRTLLAWQLGPPFTADRFPALLERLFLEDPATGQPMAIRDRLEQLRAGPPGPEPRVASAVVLHADDPPRSH